MIESASAGSAFSRSQEDAAYFNEWLKNSLDNFEADLASEHEEIDKDHRTLLNLALEINNSVMIAGNDTVMTGLVERMSLYFGDHFATEEALMLKIGYPGLASHRKEHQLLASGLDLFVVEFNAGQRQVETLHRFLRHFVLSHIPRADKNLIVWLRERSGKPPENKTNGELPGSRLAFGFS